MPPDRVAMVGALVAALATTTAGPDSGRPTPDAVLPVLRAVALEPTAVVKVFHSAGTIRVVGWDRDSLVVRGRVPAGARFFFGGGAKGVKLGVEDAVDRAESVRCDLVLQVPRRAMLSVKTASADIRGSDVSGWFYSSTGSIALAGSATSVEAETMRGNLDLAVAAPWVRARTGDGHLLLRGAPQDADASTVGGTLDVASTAILRGRFASVTGDIHYVGSPPEGAILELSNHAGTVDFLLPRAGAAGVFDLSTVTGAIENGFAEVRPIASAPGAAGRGGSMRLTFGRGGGHVVARTFKGTIRLRPQ